MLDTLQQVYCTIEEDLSHLVQSVGLAVPRLSKGSGAGSILINKCPPSPQEENPRSFPPAAAFDVCLFNDIIGSQSSVMGGVLVQRTVRVFYSPSCQLYPVTSCGGSCQTIWVSTVQLIWFWLVNCFYNILKFDFREFPASNFMLYNTCMNQLQ